MNKDPLLDYESQLYREYEAYLLRKQREPSIGTRIYGMFKFFTVYLILSGTIFSVLLGILNFGAYSARLLNWVDPTALLSIKTDIQSVISASSIEVHASEAEQDTRSESLALIEEKVAETDPSIVYSRSYAPNRLLGNIPESGIAEPKFEVAPYENRIIIPRLGKNIPLIDVFHDQDADYIKMHEIFMEELRKGVVRYPGTARPGEVGNVFIFGHSSNYPWVKSEYNQVFALLDTLKNGDDIVIFYGQKKYTYRITDRATVKPGDMDVLASRDPKKKELAIMTCWPIGTTLERIILFGELVENESTSRETSQTWATHSGSTLSGITLSWSILSGTTLVK